MGLTLADVMRDRGTYKLNDLSQLLPELVETVLLMDGAENGATVGDWVIVEPAEGIRGFQCEQIGIIEATSRMLQVLQLKPGILAVMINTESHSAGGVLDYRPIQDPQSIEAPEGAIEENRVDTNPQRNCRCAE